MPQDKSTFVMVKARCRYSLQLQLLSNCPSTPVAVKIFNYIRPMSEVALATNFISEKMVVQEGLILF